MAEAAGASGPRVVLLTKRRPERPRPADAGDAATATQEEDRGAAPHAQGAWK